MMDIRVHEEVHTQNVIIRIRLGTDSQDPSKEVWMNPPSVGGVEIVPMGAEPPVYMTIPAGVWESLRRYAAAGIEPPDSDIKRHLDDALTTRDRLLDLVDRVVVSP